MEVTHIRLGDLLKRFHGNYNSKLTYFPTRSRQDTLYKLTLYEQEMICENNKSIKKYTVAIMASSSGCPYLVMGNLVSIDSDNGLALSRHQVITWTNAVLSSIKPRGTKLSEIQIRFHYTKCISICCLQNGYHFVAIGVNPLWPSTVIQYGITELGHHGSR